MSYAADTYSYFNDITSYTSKKNINLSHAELINIDNLDKQNADNPDKQNINNLDKQITDNLDKQITDKTDKQNIINLDKQITDKLDKQIADNLDKQNINNSDRQIIYKTDKQTTDNHDKQNIINLDKPSKQITDKDCRDIIEKKIDIIKTNGNNQQTIIEVLDIDSFDAAKILIDKYDTVPLVLNMASDFVPGGGWRKNSIAQEEVLFYRSTYAMSLEPMKKSYPLKPNEVIYSKYIFVFKDNNYQLLPWDKCYLVSCIAVAGIRNPKLVIEQSNKNSKSAIEQPDKNSKSVSYLNNQLHDGKLSSKDRNLLRKKIHSIFQIAIKYNHECLVLGAIGCGVFNNPPECVAQEFNKVLKHYTNKFKHIIFAILSTKDTKNFDTFKKIIT